MKTPVAVLVLAAAALCTGSTLAQTRPRAAVPASPPAVGTVPAGQGQGQTRGTGGDGSNRDHIDQDAQADVRGRAGFQTNLGATPVNGVGGTGGGRMTRQEPTGQRVINNSASDTAPPAVGTVPADQGQGQSPRAGIGFDYDLGGATLGDARSTSTGLNGGTIAGTLGGAGALGGSPQSGGEPPVAAEAIINTSRSNIHKPHDLAEVAGAGTGPTHTWMPLVPQPQEPTTIGRGDRQTPAMGAGTAPSTTPTGPR